MEGKEYPVDNPLLTVTPREITRKKVKVLRRQGVIPVHMYGKDIPSMALQSEAKALEGIVAKAGKNIPVSLDIEGQSGQHMTFIREVQRDPISGKLLHVDFQRVITTELVRSQVPIVLVGEAPAVRMTSGMLSQILHELSVESLPMNVPQVIEIDVTVLDSLDKEIRVQDISVGTDVSVLTAPDQLVARVTPPRVELVGEAEEAKAEAVAEEAGVEAQEGKPEA